MPTAWPDYEEGKAEAEQELADARKELEQARRDLDALEDCSWYLLGRGTNTGYASYEHGCRPDGQSGRRCSP